MKNLDLYWKPIINKYPCKQFSTAHIVSLVIIFFIIILVHLFRDVLKKKEYERIFSHTVGIILILHQISIYYWYINNDMLCLKESLPLYMCRISVILSIFMMFNKSYKIFDIIYFWGLGGALIALLFHDTSLFAFPHYIFIQFFISHGGVLISLFFMMFVHGYKPNLNSLKRTYVVTCIYFLITIPTNYICNSNYGYLRKRPKFTYLEYVPENPIFFVPLIIIGVYLLYCLLYLPYRKKATV